MVTVLVTILSGIGEEARGYPNELGGRCRFVREVDDNTFYVL